MCSVGFSEGGLMKFFFMIGFSDVIFDIISPYVVYIEFLVALSSMVELGYFKRFAS